ncbi:MAG: hypothetical protein K0S42_3196 [Microvirga sp.]|nr:hypothetical protein [Microvirga sp.]
MLDASVDIGAVGSSLGPQDLQFSVALEESSIPQPTYGIRPCRATGACNENIGLRGKTQDLTFQPTDVAAKEATGLLYEPVG